jgi:phenylalanine-4-hydroxylase
LKQVELKKFTPAENQTWKALFTRQSQKRAQQIVPEFARGLEALAITPDLIPDLEQVNSRLQKLTGWRGVPVEGLEEGESFYSMLAQKMFPIGNFIRDEKDLSYTPAPDVFHDLYGHLPFFANSEYAEFCQQYGKLAMAFKDDHEKLREFERFFWFTIEFGLMETSEGRRIFGAGLASSFSECDYALSDKPLVRKFDVELLRQQEFRIDIFQEKLFVLQNPEQLYQSLEQLAKHP